MAHKCDHYMGPRVTPRDHSLNRSLSHTVTHTDTHSHSLNHNQKGVYTTSGRMVKDGNGA